MTAQRSDVLINEHPRIDFHGRRPYSVVAGDISTNYGWGEIYEFPISPNVRKDEPKCTSLWRGYVATLRLNPSGELELLSYEYPYRIPPLVETIHRKLDGDFWLVLKHFFDGPRMYVPFHEGRIVKSLDSWRQEDPRIIARVVLKRNRILMLEGSILVHISRLPLEQRENADALVGQWARCVIKDALVDKGGWLLASDVEFTSDEDVRKSWWGEQLQKPRILWPVRDDSRSS